MTRCHHNDAVALLAALGNVVPHLVTSGCCDGQAVKSKAMGRRVPRVQGVEGHPGPWHHRGNKVLAGHKRSRLQVNGCLRAIEGRDLPGGLEKLLVGLQQHRCPRLHPLCSHLDDEGVFRKHTERWHEAWHQQGLE